MMGGRLPKKQSSSRLNHHLSDYKASSLMPKTRLDQYLHVPVLNNAHHHGEMRGASPDSVNRHRGGIYSRGGKPRNQLQSEVKNKLFNNVNTAVAYAGNQIEFNSQVVEMRKPSANLASMKKP